MQRKTQYMCPHCGMIFENLTGSLIPIHKWERGHNDCIRCPGSEQAPRNPLSDRRPLWKDMTPEKEEALKFAAKEEDSGSERVCEPNGFGFCMTHPTCDHVRCSLIEAQTKIANQAKVIQKLCHQNDLYRAMRRIDIPTDGDVAKEQRRNLESLVRIAWEHIEISTMRAAEILGLDCQGIRDKIAEEKWSYIDEKE
jgi:DNA-directed RNA polymerase subunit M/transcription elongation factor TFIIS